MNYSFFPLKSRMCDSPCVSVVLCFGFFFFGLVRLIGIFFPSGDSSGVALLSSDPINETFFFDLFFNFLFFFFLLFFLFFSYILFFFFFRQSRQDTPTFLFHRSLFFPSSRSPHICLLFVFFSKC